MAHYNPHLKKWFKSKETSNRAEGGIRTWRKNRKVQKHQTGAINSIILLFIGIYFSIPGPQNIGWIIVDILAKESGIISTLELPFKILFNLLGAFGTFLDIKYIIKQIKKRNYLS